MNNHFNHLVRKRTVNEDGTITLSAPQWIIIAEASTPEGYPLFYGIRVLIPSDGIKTRPESAAYTPLTNIELLPDGYQT